MIDEIMKEYYALDDVYQDWLHDARQVPFWSPEPKDEIVQEKPAPLQPQRLCIRVDTFEELCNHKEEGRLLWCDGGTWRCMFWTLSIVHMGDWTGSERGWDWIS